MSLLVKNVRLDNENQHLYVEDSRITSIDKNMDLDESKPDTVIDGQGLMAVPTLHNGHTHAAMTLFRGYGDDLPLQTWLEDKIWPLEEQLTEEHVYWATRLACLEMIRTGTTFFNDMYWEFDAIRRAVVDSGIRARLSGVFIDQFDGELARQQREANEKLFEKSSDFHERISFSLGPHSVYTVSKESLKWIADFSRNNNLPVHIHLAETEWEVQQCTERHGARPVKFLDEIGFLHENVVAAHAIWLNDEEINLLAKNNVGVVYNPISNLKLTAGADFRYQDLKDAGVPVCLGTDGVASNNNFNLLEEIKTASILQKNRQKDPTVLPAQETFDLATGQASDIFGLDTGTLKEGMLADLMLVDLETPSMNLASIHDTESHKSYTLTPDSIDTVVCNGNVLLNEDVFTNQDADNIFAKHRKLANKLCYE